MFIANDSSMNEVHAVVYRTKEWVNKKVYDKFFLFQL